MPPVQYIENTICKPEDGKNYIFHTTANNSNSLHDISTGSENINIFVGPEGGWSDREMEYFQKQAFQTVNL